MTKQSENFSCQSSGSPFSLLIFLSSSTFVSAFFLFALTPISSIVQRQLCLLLLWFLAICSFLLVFHPSTTSQREKYSYISTYAQLDGLPHLKDERKAARSAKPGNSLAFIWEPEGAFLARNHFLQHQRPQSHVPRCLAWLMSASCPILQ